MNAEHIEREFEAYRKDDAAARAILDLAAEEKRSTSPEEDERFDKLIASAEAHKARADKLAEMDAHTRDLGEAVRHIVSANTDAGSGSPSEIRGLNSAIIANLRAAQAAHLGGLEFTERFVDGLVDLEARAIADFSDNGALYTTDFATTVAVYQRTVSPWINLATVINANNGRPINLPNLTADPTSYTPGEGTAITESTPTIGSAALTTTAYKGLSYVSAEADEDELIGLLPIIARAQGRSIGLKFGSTLTAAIVAAATNGGTATGLGGGSTATFLGYEDLLDLKYGRAVPYRAAGSWVMANSVIKKARKWTNTQGAYLWQPAIAAGQPPMLDDSPVYEDPYLATIASASKSVLFGDVSAVTIKQMPLRVATSTEFAFNTDNVALKSVYRAGGALADAAAIAYLVAANA